MTKYRESGLFESGNLVRKKKKSKRAAAKQKNQGSFITRLTIPESLKEPARTITGKRRLQDGKRNRVG